jgi:hypothetical protein
VLLSPPSGDLPLMPNEHERLWSDQFGFWIGPWRGIYKGEERT